MQGCHILCIQLSYFCLVRKLIKLRLRLRGLFRLLLRLLLRDCLFLMLKEISLNSIVNAVLPGFSVIWLMQVCWKCLLKNCIWMFMLRRLLQLWLLLCLLISFSRNLHSNADKNFNSFNITIDFTFATIPSCISFF